MEEKLIPVEYSNQRILTTVQLAWFYETDVKIISQNFSRNKDRYVEGKHFYRLEGEALRQFKTDYYANCASVETTNPQIEEWSRASVLYLWTEKGAWLHAKSLNTDKAWEAYEMLVDEYYRLREQSIPPAQVVSGLAGLDGLIAQTEQGIKRNQQALGYLKKARTLFTEGDFVKQSASSQKLLKPVYSQKELEDKILIYVEKNQNQTDLDKVPTIRNLSRYTRATVDVLRPIVEDLIRMNVLCKVQAGKAIYYIPAA